MAEGFARHFHADRLEPYSAGVDPRGMNPRAVRVMAEAGVDISGGRAKHVDELRDIPFDFVFTVCGHAQETCPAFPGETRVRHVGFEDPPVLAAGAGSEEEALGHYRRVRDEIKAWIQNLPDSLGD